MKCNSCGNELPWHRRNADTCGNSCVPESENKVFYKKPSVEQKKNNSLNNKYGLSLEEYNDKLKSQNGCCDICGSNHRGFKRALSVDHDHSTGEVRSLLCNNCNVALGLLKEDINTMKNMINYISKYQ